jgi:hypothetical protein
MGGSVQDQLEELDQSVGLDRDQLVELGRRGEEDLGPSEDLGRPQVAAFFSSGE